ncbi:MAG: TlpA family protein disulfide reductase [Lachnospiraceae bacterium]|nr:TlpA family protein disulfide reductase [Lachnospiraceae bacterium]
MKKRIIVILLAMAVVLAATACKSGSDTTAKDSKHNNSSKEDSDSKNDLGSLIDDVFGGKSDESPGVATPTPEVAEAIPTQAAAAATEIPEEWNPDFTFNTTDFDMFRWDDTCFANAKLTMINLWAYWCGPCVGELPEIEKISNDYASKGLQVFGISYPEEETENREMAAEQGITYQNLFYTSDFDQYMDSGYLPTTIFVDSKGHVLGEAIIGARSYEDWAEIIDNYLSQQ